MPNPSSNTDAGDNINGGVTKRWGQALQTTFKFANVKCKARDPASLGIPLSLGTKLAVQFSSYLRRHRHGKSIGIT
jgi:hypothetical protein